MMYDSKMVVCLKVNGKVLREFKDEVYIPYGSEYSLLVKNLNSRRASVDITIDGKPIFANCESLVVDGNTEVEVERFVTNANRGNRFKFIERTAKIEQHKGIGAEDGLIRVAFQYEKPVVRSRSVFRGFENPTIYGTSAVGTKGLSQNAFLNQVNVGATMDSCFTDTSVPLASPGVSVYEKDTCTEQKNDVGITVPGSISNQKFQSVASFAVEDEVHVIVLRLLGDIGQNGKVDKPITVKTKLECKTCGTKSKATAKFCPECSASLELVA